MGVLAPAFPAPFPSGVKPVRFYATAAATANFVDHQYSFQRSDPATPSVPEQGWCGNIAIRAVGANVEFSFDGTTVHGLVLSGTQTIYQHRYEGGIAIRGAGATFYVEAW